MSNVHPCIIEQDASLRALQPVATGDRQYHENWLQNLLFKHPDLLPIADIDPGFGKLIPLAREVPVSSGYIDVLYATADGSLCLVETKLWRNPEAHRTVLAQLLDYAKALTRLDFSEFRACVQEAASRNGHAANLDGMITRSLGGSGFNSVDFEANVRRALASGDFLLLIVGDRIRPEVVLLSDILGTAPNLEFSLALVEMNFYHLNSQEEWPMLAAPTVVGRSHEVTRAVVRIRYEEKRPEVDVAAVEEQNDSAGRTSPEIFLKSLPSGLDEVFRPYIEHWMAGSHTVYWGKIGFSLRHHGQDKKKKRYTFFDAYPTYISVVKEEWVAEREIPQEIYREYREAVSNIPEVQQTFSRGGRYVYYAKLTIDETRVLLEATDHLAVALTDREAAVWKA